MIHIKPSWFVRKTRRYTDWTTVCVCTGCGLRAKSEDAHDTEPCPSCGARMRRDVGRWVETHLPWWKTLFTTPDGEWQLLKENIKERTK